MIIQKRNIPSVARNKHYKYASSNIVASTSFTVPEFGGGGGSSAALAFFEVRYVNDIPYVVCTAPLASEYDITAYSQNPESLPDLWSGMPLASDTVKGGIKYDPSTLAINTNGQLTVIGGGGGGVSSWNDLTDKPVWLALATLAQFEAGHGHAWDKITATPTTLAGYGITDAATSTHTHAFAEITAKPTTISGYGITDAYTKTNMQTSGGAQLHWNNLTNKPTTFAPSAHTHAIADIANLQTTLDGKAALNGSGSQNFATNNLSVAGNLTITGTITQVDTEIVKSTNDLIITRDGATTGLIAGTYTGIQATKYDGTYDGQLVFGSDGFARVGDVGQLQIIATREDAPIDTGIAYFDSSTQKFLTKNEGDLDVWNSYLFNNKSITNFYQKDALKAAGEFYLGTTNPTNINRLNYDGYLYGTRMYSRGAEVVNESAVQSLSNKTLLSPTLTTPKFVNGGSINDSNGNELLKFTSWAGAVNEINISNASTGTPPTVSVSGNDTNITLQLNAKGSGIIDLNAKTSVANWVNIKGHNQWFGNGLDIFVGGTTNDVGIRNDTGNIYFGNDNAKVTIDLNGNMGIGTTPTSKLHVNGNARIDGDLYTNGAFINQKGLTSGQQLLMQAYQFSDPANWGLNLYQYHTGNAIDFRYKIKNGTSTEIENMWFKSNGDIGLGISPTEKLHVSGNILASGEVTAYSDARLKTNVTTLQSVLTKIKQLRPVAYTKDEKRSIGLIAQEVQPWFPELVNTNGEYLSLNYAQLTAVLIKAVQEILKKIEKN